MMKDTYTATANELGMKLLKDLDAAATEEVIIASEQSRENSLSYQSEDYRIWRCNGVPIGIHTHKQRS